MDAFFKSFLESLRAYEPEKVVLFGSHAHGTADPYSDVDLIIIKRTTKSFAERWREIIPYLQYPGKNIQVFVYTPEEFELMRQMENPFILHALKGCKILYEKSHSGI